MKKTTAENIDDRQAGVDDMSANIEAAADSLSNAVSCETPEDFDENIDEAINYLKIALSELKAFRL